MNKIFNSSGNLNAASLKQALDTLAKYASSLDLNDQDTNNIIKAIDYNCIKSHESEKLINAIKNNKNILEEELSEIITSFSAQKAKEIRANLDELIVKEIIE